MKLKLEIFVVVAAFVAIALLADAWRSARRDSQQLAVTMAAQNSAIQQAADREKQRDSQLATLLSTIQSQKRSVQTPQEASAQILSVLPTLPLPVSIHDPDLSVPLPPGTSPSTTLSLPQPDIIPLYDDLQDCRASTAEKDAIQKDLADEKTRSIALQRERDAAVAAAHGGTFFCPRKACCKMVCNRPRRRRCRSRRSPPLSSVWIPQPFTDQDTIKKMKRKKIVPRDPG